MKCKRCGGAMVPRGTRDTRPFMIVKRTVYVYRCARCKEEEELLFAPSALAWSPRPVWWKCGRCSLKNEHHRKKCRRCGWVVAR